MMKMMHSIVLMVSVILVSGFAFAQTDDVTLFKAGNDLYNKGKYQEAIEKYLEIVDHGQHSTALYYNLGNSYYKLNQIAPSIYYYEKALLLDPNDADVKNNLQYAKNMTVDAIDVLPQTGVGKMLENVIGVFPYSTWAFLAIVFMVLFVLMFLFYYFADSHQRKRLYFVVSFLCLAISLISIGFAYNQHAVQQKQRPAIIFAKETSATSEPNMGSAGVFQLHEGTKVNVLDTLGEWKKIRLSDGKIGWLPESELKEIKDF